MCYSGYTSHINGRYNAKKLYVENEDIFMESKNLFSIGEIAKSIGITRKIILNYEAKGLISPDKKDGTAVLIAGLYEKATDDKKLEVKIENAVAVQSAFCVDNLKDPDSFVLREAYCTEGSDTYTDSIVLFVSGANSYGAKVSSYWLFTYDSEENEWVYHCSLSDLSLEEASSYDDEDERLEIAMNNLYRLRIEAVIQNGIELSKDAVKRINTMFEQDILDEVKLLDIY